MKKFLALALALIFTFSLCLVSCGNEPALNEDELAALEDINESVMDEFDNIDGYVPGKNNGGSDSKGGMPELNGKTPEKLYAEASAKINSADNITTISKQDIDMVIEYQGQKQEQLVKQTVTTKYAGNDFSIVSENDMGEGEINSCYVDGVVYNVQFTDGQKIKYEATLEQMSQKLGVDTSSSKVLDIPDDWFSEEVKFFKDKKTDTYYITFKLSGDQYKKIFSNMNALSGVSFDDISDVSHTVYFTEDGDLSYAVSTMSLEMETQGIVTKASYLTTTTFENLGSTVVEAPENPDSYRLVTIDQVG